MLHGRPSGSATLAPVDAHLDAAYRATTYRVYGPSGSTPIDIRVGESSTRLEALLGGHAETWAFITAWNPESRQLSADENHERHSALMQTVRERGWRTYQGLGIPSGSEWEPETSLLVLGISRQQAIELGVRFGQNAVVTGESGRPAELVYCTVSHER